MPDIRDLGLAQRPFISGQTDEQRHQGYIRRVAQMRSQRAALEMAKGEFERELEPFLKNDPVARLGFSADRVRVAHPVEGSDAHKRLFGAYAQRGVQEKGIHGAAQSLYGDFFAGTPQGVEDDTVYINEQATGDHSVYMHEFRHRGFAEIRRRISEMTPEQKKGLAREMTAFNKVPEYGNGALLGIMSRKAPNEEYFNRKYDIQLEGDEGKTKIMEVVNADFSDPRDRLYLERREPVQDDFNFVATKLGGFDTVPTD